MEQLKPYRLEELKCVELVMDLKLRLEHHHLLVVDVEVRDSKQ